MGLLQGKTILVVEDDTDLREVISDMLKSHGATITEAANGKIAFELIKAERFDAVLSDVRMPGGDGISLMEQINAHLPVAPKLFICSGFNDLSKEDLSRLHILAVFPKPFDEEEVVAAIAGALGTAGSK